GCVIAPKSSLSPFSGSPARLATLTRRRQLGRMASPLEHYGLIGDLTTIALVSRTGSMDWLCLPRIDSDACFARLLGNDNHGYWAIRPASKVRELRHRYRPDTLVLETEM